jgi:hypothetical protein
MSKLQRILYLIDLPAILPSIIVAVVHFRLSVLVGSHANQVFQHWFDSGEKASGADAVIASIDRVLATPIPTVWLAGHPAKDLSAEWWIATVVNSILWGVIIYFSYILSGRILKRLK